MMDDQQHNQAKKSKPKRGWAFYGGWLFFIFFLVKVFWHILGALGLGLASRGYRCTVFADAAKSWSSGWCAV